MKTKRNRMKKKNEIILNCAVSVVVKYFIYSCDLSRLHVCMIITFKSFIFMMICCFETFQNLK